MISAASVRPRVLVLDEESPFPPDTGKKIRTLNLLTRLSSEFEIDLLVHDGPDARKNQEILAARGIRVHVSRSRVPSKQGLSFYLRLLGNLVSADPYSVTSHYLDEYHTQMQDLLERTRPALIHCEWTPYARYLRDIEGYPNVVAAHNVESQIWSRMADSEPSVLKRAYIRIQSRKMQRFEKQVFSSGPWITAVSEEDALQIRRLGGSRVGVVPNGVDTRAYRVAPDDRIEPRSLVFTGSMDWRPNQDAIRWFIDEIHPRLTAHGPYRLQVVGRRPPRWLEEACAAVDEIELTGTVPDVRPYLSRGQIVIVPLRIGGGSRLKILEAFSAQRAVVSTTIGAEGLSARDGEHLVLADDADSFVQAIVGLRDDHDRLRQLARSGRELAEREYDWNQIATRQGRIWNEAAA